MVSAEKYIHLLSINPQREFLKNKAIKVGRGFVESRVEKSKEQAAYGYD